MNSQALDNLRKVWECLETFPTEKERTQRRWVLNSREENIQNMEDTNVDELFNLRYEIWK